MMECPANGKEAFFEPSQPTRLEIQPQGSNKKQKRSKTAWFTFMGVVEF